MDFEKIFFKRTSTNNEKEFLYYLEGNSGSFVKALCQAYELGDADNRRRLEIAYPFLLGYAARGYMQTQDQACFLKHLKGL